MEAETLVPTVRPFWGRATLIESPVDESELESGLVLPHTFDGDGGVKRGVIQDVDPFWDEIPSHEHVRENLKPGTVVFYTGGTRIRDVVVVQMIEILAFETGE